MGSEIYRAFGAYFAVALEPYCVGVPFSTVSRFQALKSRETWLRDSCSRGPSLRIAIKHCTGNTDFSDDDEHHAVDVGEAGWPVHSSQHDAQIDQINGEAACDQRGYTLYSAWPK